MYIKETFMYFYKVYKKIFIYEHTCVFHFLNSKNTLLRILLNIIFIKYKIKYIIKNTELY